MKDTFDWTKIVSSPIYSNIIREWENLLDDSTKKEKEYHQFLFTYPGFFLTIIESYVVISKFKLGSIYETDFIIVKEGYSDGTIYEIIEIESPHTILFDKSGKLSSKFNSSLQQIRDWKRYLIEEKNFFSRFLPTSSTKVIKNSKLKFKIIIGRRSEDRLELERRRQICETEGIEILSFDRLTDIAKSRRVFSNEPSIYASQLEHLDYAIKNQLANPFFECTSDSNWKRICQKGHTNHFHYNYLNEILENRTYNSKLEEFKRYLEEK